MMTSEKLEKYWKGCQAAHQYAPGIIISSSKIHTRILLPRKTSKKKKKKKSRNIYVNHLEKMA